MTACWRGAPRLTCENGERSGFVPDAMVASLQTIRKDTTPRKHARTLVTHGLAVQLQTSHKIAMVFSAKSDSLQQVQDCSVDTSPLFLRQTYIMEGCFLAPVHAPGFGEAADRYDAVCRAWQRVIACCLALDDDVKLCGNLQRFDILCQQTCETVICIYQGITQTCWR